MLARVAAVIGAVCVGGVVVAVPALADTTLIQGTPCTKGARACVDLIKQKAWLLDPAGNVVRGPVTITSGGPGKETQPGTFKVQWKDKNHFSNESRTPQGTPAPMPFSVFFAEGGVAFHGGSLERASAGCVHLADPDAEAFYNTLQIGDQVQVHNGNDTPEAQQGGDEASQARDSEGSSKPSSSDRPKRSGASASPSATADSSGDDDSSSGSSGERKPSANRGSSSDHALDLDRSPVGGGSLPHRL
ncbi:L,D-transpeptidase [Pseudonocardia acaciae]|uniref:L,D-transpeptidase n=1 Tax=Pseudonocardia acaciae TaxID=551276 RepID=UPI001FDECA0C|nr:L,D-transpeptidase [Pseudonocardia acaciae]